MGYTRIGDIVIFKKGVKIEKIPASATTVLIQEGGCSGPYRLPKYRVIKRRSKLLDTTIPKWVSLGETQTLHRENGQRYIVDWAKTYYNSRYAEERMRLKNQLRGDKLLVLYSGVGPLLCMLSKNYTCVEGVQWNPHAIYLAYKNLRLNRIFNVKLNCADVLKFISQMPSDKYDDVITFSPTCDDAVVFTLMQKVNRVIHYKLVSNNMILTTVKKYTNSKNKVVHRIVKDY